MSFSNLRKWTVIKNGDREEVAVQPSRFERDDLLLLSPDKFWILELSGPIRETTFYQRLEKTKIGIFATGGGSSEFYGPAIHAGSIEDAAAQSLRWADGMMLEYAKRLFLNRWRTSGKVHPEVAFARKEEVRKARRYLSEFLRGEASKMAAPPKLQRSMAAYYIRQFAKYLEDKIADIADIASLQDAATFLSIDPLYRPLLPDKLSVTADKLEGLGKIEYKENPGRRSGRVSPAKDLISKCQELWEVYYSKPTKKNLDRVFAHLDEMKKSKSEKVKRERLRCLRVANREPDRRK